MASIPFPGFGPGAHQPTPEIFNRLRDAAALNYTAFASREHFKQQGGTVAIDGSPKYWNVPYAVRPLKWVFLKRNDDGSYPSRPMSRSAATHPVEHLVMRASVGVFDSRPHIQVPLMKIVEIPYAEVGRLSLPDEEVEDPGDFPLCGIAEDGTPLFPSNCIVHVRDGKPFIATHDDVLREYPVQWQGPTPVTPQIPAVVNATDVLRMADKLTKTSAARVAALPILNGPGAAEAKLAALLAL